MRKPLLNDFLRLIAILVLLFSQTDGLQAADSVCYGTPANGRIEHAVQLPNSGKNFQAYSRLGITLGRTYAHAKVARAVGAAYAAVATAAPGKVFVYGESGFEDGGRFKPHKTHQNGVSVDFFVPVLDDKGRSVALPGSASNRYGYDIEFDADARYRLGAKRTLRIDFDAMAEHLYALDRAAKAAGAPIDRVIFEPDYLPKLFATKRGAYLRRHVEFVRGKVWWRHDEHYHVDFTVKCRALR
ncbi:MAG: replication initiation protein [Lysobacter sp.]|nr:MAG: replication initiation protein [Lysobacter sp.]